MGVSEKHTTGGDLPNSLPHRMGQPANESEQVFFYSPRTCVWRERERDEEGVVEIPIQSAAVGAEQQWYTRQEENII